MIGTETLIAGIIALFAAIAAFMERNEAVKQEAEKKVVIDFFDPDNSEVTNGNQVPMVPKRSWIMNQETKNWVCQGHGEGTKGELLKQIAEAEMKGLTDYYITYNDPTRGEAGYYHIEWGILSGSGMVPQPPTATVTGVR